MGVLKNSRFSLNHRRRSTFVSFGAGQHSHYCFFQFGALASALHAKLRCVHFYSGSRRWHLLFRDCFWTGLNCYQIYFLGLLAVVAYGFSSPWALCFAEENSKNITIDNGILKRRQKSVNQLAVSRAQFNLGLLYQNEGRLIQALKQYKLAVNNDPEFVEAYNSLGIVNQKLGHLEAAISAYQTALRINPDFAEAKSHLIEARRLANEGRFNVPEARKKYSSKKKKRPKKQKRRSRLDAEIYRDAFQDPFCP